MSLTDSSSVYVKDVFSLSKFERKLGLAGSLFVTAVKMGFKKKKFLLFHQLSLLSQYFQSISQSSSYRDP